MVSTPWRNARNLSNYAGRACALPRHQFWPDDIAYGADVIERITGYRQVTDSYLCHLASAHDGTLATYDRALAALHTKSSVLVPTTPEQTTKA